VGGVLLVLLLLAVLGVGGWLGYRWTQTQYYLAPDGDVVAIYRGIPQEVGPVTLSTVHTRTDLRLDELPGYVRDRLEATITVASLEQAEARVGELRSEARGPDPSPSPSPTPSPTPTTTPPRSEEHTSELQSRENL